MCCHSLTLRTGVNLSNNMPIELNTIDVDGTCYLTPYMLYNYPDNQEESTDELVIVENRIDKQYNDYSK